MNIFLVTWGCPFEGIVSFKVTRYIAEAVSLAQKFTKYKIPIDLQKWEYEKKYWKTDKERWFIEPSMTELIEIHKLKV